MDLVDKGPFIVIIIITLVIKIREMHATFPTMPLCNTVLRMRYTRQTLPILEVKRRKGQQICERKVRPSQQSHQSLSMAVQFKSSPKTFEASNTGLIWEKVWRWVPMIITLIVSTQQEGEIVLKPWLHLQIFNQRVAGAGQHQEMVEYWTNSEVFERHL